MGGVTSVVSGVCARVAQIMKSWETSVHVVHGVWMQFGDLCKSACMLLSSEGAEGWGVYTNWRR